MKTLLFLVCGVLAAFTFVSAQDLTATSKEGQAVHLVSERLKESQDSKVQVKDVVLDLETGHAALQIVSWQHTDSAKPVVAVAPFLPKLDVTQATKLAKELATTEPPSLTRKLAAAVHSTFGRDVYWANFIKGLRPERNAKFDKEAYELVSFTSIKDKKIVDVDDGVLGTLTDIGLRDSGDIAYCVLKNSDNELRAIPLGAFLNRERDKDWKIELKREQVFQFSPFKPESIPQEIDRGWQEYVAVRYGRDTLQEVPKANKPPE